MHMFQPMRAGPSPKVFNLFLVAESALSRKKVKGWIGTRSSSCMTRTFITPPNPSNWELIVIQSPTCLANSSVSNTPQDSHSEPLSSQHMAITLYVRHLRWTSVFLEKEHFFPIFGPQPGGTSEPQEGRVYSQTSSAGSAERAGRAPMDYWGAPFHEKRNLTTSALQAELKSMLQNVMMKVLSLPILH